MQRVLLHFDAFPELAPRLAALAGEGIAVEVIAPTEADRLAATLPEVDVLWHVLAPVTRAMIDAAPRLRLIQKIGVGVNTIDLAAARARGIAVCNMPGTNTPAVAEMTLALIFACLRKLASLDRAMRRGEGFALPVVAQIAHGELHGRTVGFVGFGAVPQYLAPVLAALGARVRFWNRRPKVSPWARQVPWEILLAESDILSLHLPLVPETERLLDAAALARLKPGAVLVNTARGGLVDEEALIAALRSRQIAAAGLDVFALEPPAPHHPLFALDNVVLTPHVAWLTPETWDRSLAVAVENCRRLAAGAPLLHRIV
ncbi:Hydroxypyruvate reductase [bacterium HR40]|nr:Hydroxypyruvate reductase [bacterium HR40]